MESFAPPIGNYLNLWWGVPSAIWILGATEGVKRSRVVPCRYAWLVCIVFGVLGGALWALFGPPPDGDAAAIVQCHANGARRLSDEVAYGTRAAFLSAGLFTAGSHALDEIRRGRRNGHDRSASGGPEGST